MPILKKIMITISVVTMIAAQALAGETKTYSDTQIMILPACPVTGQGAESILVALGAALLPPLIDVGIDTVAETLKVAGANKDTVVKSSANGFFYALDKEGNLKSTETFGCVVVIKGSFGETPKTDGFHGIFSTRKGSLIPLGLVEDPSFYFEARVKYSDDNTAFKLVPSYLYYNKFFASSLFTSKRDLVLTLNFHKVGGAADNNAFAASTIAFKDLNENSSISFKISETGGNYKESIWMPLMPIDESLKTTIEGQKKNQEELNKINLQITTLGKNDEMEPGLQTALKKLCALEKEEKKKLDPECFSLAEYQDNLMKTRNAVKKIKNELSRSQQLDAANKKKKQLIKEITAIDNLSPFYIEAAITETKQGNKYVAFASSVFNASKDDLKTGIKNEVVKADKEKKQEDDEKAKKDKQDLIDKAKVDALQAQIEVEKAEVNLQGITATGSAIDIKNAESDVKLKKFEANIKFKNAGLSEPYPGIF